MKKNSLKTKTKGGEKMMKNSLKVLLGFAAVLFLVTACSANDIKTVNLTTTVPSTSVLSIGISKVVGTVFTPGQTSMDFGLLTYDPAFKIYRGPHYFAVDVGINSNALGWNLAHSKTSFAKGIDNLDTHVNVTFVKYNGITEVPITSPAGKVSYLNSTLTINKSTAGFAANDWLRVYYGIATGTTVATPGNPIDNPSVTPVPVTQPFGAYAGVVTYTLTAL